MLSEIKSLVRHSSVYSLGSLLSKAVSFIMLPIYTHVLTPSDYGILELLTLSSTVIAMLLSLKLTSAMPRFYHEYREESRKQTIVSTTLLFSIWTSVVMVSGLFLLRGEISGFMLGKPEYGDYFGYVLITMVCEIVGTIGYTYLRILEKSMLFVGFSMLQLVLGLSLNILFLVGLKMGVMGALWSMLISSFLTAAALLGYIFMKVGMRFDWRQFKQLAGFSLPLVPAAIATFVLNMGDRFILNRFVDTAAVGVYSLGYKFGILLGTFVGGPFLQAWEPKRAEIYEHNPEAKEIFQRVFLYSVFALVFGGLVISVLIREIVTVMAAPGYMEACLVTPLVVLGYVFYTAFCVLDIGIFVKKKTFWYPIINGLAAVLNVAMNLVLIPRMGIMGAAVATAASFMFQACLAYWISQRYYPLTYDFYKVLKISFPALLIYFAAHWLETGNIFVNAFAKLGLLALYPPALLILGVFEKEERAYFGDLIKGRWVQLQFLFRR